MNQHSASKSKKFVTVSQFLEAGKKELNLDLVAGEAGLERNIEEPAVNRPGLALTGFFQYFAHRRIQVLGHAEHAYLASFTEEEREPRLRSVLKRQIPCVVVTRTRKATSALCSLGEEFSVPILRCPLITGHFINAATLIMENLQAPKGTMQGTMVEIMGIGVMITGQSGIGKSETALALVKKGHSLVSDDVTAVRRDSSGVVLGSALNATKYHMEIRGLGIIHVPSLFGVASVLEQKRLELVISLEKTKHGKDPRNMFSEDHVGTIDVLGVKIPRVVIPIAPGRDLAGLVEVAALDQKLKRLGHDAAKELDEKLIQAMATGDSGRE